MAKLLGNIMRNYKAFYRNKTLEVVAASSYDAQQEAAKLFKARKSYEVTVMLLDRVHDTAGL